MKEGLIPGCVGMDLEVAVNMDQMNEYGTNTWVTQQYVFRLCFHRERGSYA
jgi:hypothetical protein